MPRKTAADIIVLAMLREGPLHGYELISRLHDGNFDRWIEIGDSSVYQALKHIQEKGLVKTREIRIGKKPPRVVYELNKNGVKALEKGLLDLLKTPPAYCNDLHIALFANNVLDKKSIITSLEDQKKTTSVNIKDIEKTLDLAKGNKSEIGIRLIYERLHGLQKAHLRWLADTISIIKRH